MRSGLIAKKVGMTRFFSVSGQREPVTALSVESCQVVAVRTIEKDGYLAIQVGTGFIKKKNVTKAQQGHFRKGNLEPKSKVAEFRVSADYLLKPGTELSVNHFLVGQFVDVTGKTIGKGFAGVMKRHKFRGLEASHGVSISHRSHGSTGQRQDPGRVFKNKRMAGHMGGCRATVLSLKVLQTDVKRGLLLLKGTVPGPRGEWILVRDAVKRTLPEKEAKNT